VFRSGTRSQRRQGSLRQFLSGQFELNERVQVLPTGPRTNRLTGSTRVIGQNTVYVWKPIDGAAESMLVNSMQVWTKLDGEWRLTGFMTSALPDGTAP